MEKLNLYISICIFIYIYMHVLLASEVSPHSGWMNFFVVPHMVYLCRYLAMYSPYIHPQ